jgi:hypothetical protein
MQTSCCIWAIKFLAAGCMISLYFILFFPVPGAWPSPISCWWQHNDPPQERDRDLSFQMCNLQTKQSSVHSSSTNVRLDRCAYTCKIALIHAEIVGRLITPMYMCRSSTCIRADGDRDTVCARLHVASQAPCHVQLLHVSFFCSLRQHRRSTGACAGVSFCCSHAYFLWTGPENWQ